MIKKITKMSNQAMAYHMARLAFGASILVHGAVRFPKLSAFAEGLSGQFDETIVAGFPALALAYIIPFVEAGAGVMILAGRPLVRYGLAVVGLLMGVLMVGTGLIENWAILPSQLLHLVFAYLLLYHLED
ncbi:MAG: hypothetical protein P1U86_06900 [Verrucomicrobiales bacterium]|nr:hypothetical protein [Verrucomicrobiales bacterium]